MTKPRVVFYGGTRPEPQGLPKGLIYIAIITGLSIASVALVSTFAYRPMPVAEVEPTDVTLAEEPLDFSLPQFVVEPLITREQFDGLPLGSLMNEISEQYPEMTIVDTDTAARKKRLIENPDGSSAYLEFLASDDRGFILGAKQWEPAE